MRLRYCKADSQDSWELALQGCNALMSLSHLNNDNVVRIGKCGGCETLVVVIKKFMNENIDIVQQGTIALQNLASNTDSQNITKIVSAGGCQVLTTILERHKFIDEIMVVALSAVSYIAESNTNSHSLFGETCCAAVLAAAEKHCDDDEVVLIFFSCFKL